ncbi:MAG: hypothetical protein NZL92_10975 [Gloeomargarita sp. SKYG116]|nr:hypothetical protein [Gloeomargarita sp. SKYG116]MDW8402205.1 hypothetical protein [Gloeomargarita sp. SKYGB_i_bin116]
MQLSKVMGAKSLFGLTGQQIFGERLPPKVVLLVAMGGWWRSRAEKA